MSDKPAKKGRGWLWVIGLATAVFAVMCLCVGVAIVAAPSSDERSPPEGTIVSLETEEAPSTQEVVSPTDVPDLPTEVPSLTNTAELAATDTAAPTDAHPPTQTESEKLYSALVSRLDPATIKGVSFSQRDLVIQTSLNRSNIEWFYEDIGAIHGVVTRENPDVDRVILDDITGQQIIMPVDAMEQFHYDAIDWNAFISTWTIINP